MAGNILDFEKKYGSMKKEKIIIPGGPPNIPVYKN